MIIITTYHAPWWRMSRMASIRLRASGSNSPDTVVKGERQIYTGSVPFGRIWKRMKPRISSWLVVCSGDSQQEKKNCGRYIYFSENIKLQAKRPRRADREDRCSCSNSQRSMILGKFHSASTAFQPPLGNTEYGASAWNVFKIKRKPDLLCFALIFLPLPTAENFLPSSCSQFTPYPSPMVVSFGR